MTAATADLSTKTVAQLLTFAKDNHGLTLAPKTKKADIIAAIGQAQETEAREAQEREEARQGIEVVSLEEQKADLAALKDSPENVVVPSPLKSGTQLTREEIQARVALARQESAEAEEMRRQAEAAKAPKGRTISIEEFTRRYHKIGYGVGLMVQAIARLRKETRIADEVAQGLGEELDQEAWDLARDRMVEGYAKAWDTYQFPSKALKGMQGEEMVSGIWAEMFATQPGLAIFAQFEDPGEAEEGEEEE